jgi:serine/threonine-protein kinase
VTPTRSRPPPDEATADARTGSAPVGLPRGTFIGRYVVLDLLGEGGMGVVYKAYDPDLGRAVALKLMRARGGGSGAVRSRLLREAQGLAQLSHPNVIAVHDVGVFGDDVFIAMEFVEGRTLRAWLKERPRARREILEVFFAAGEGLAAAHRAGLVHRDFKPDNVMVGDDGRVRVLDFGLVRTTGAGAEPTPSPSQTTTQENEPTLGARPSAKPDVAPAREAAAPVARPTLDSGRITPELLGTPLTQAGAILGTPRYMAPEQHLGDVADHRADQFSFCVSLYWALYEAFPFEGSPSEMLERMLAGRIAEPPASATVPRWMRQLIVRGLDGRPDRRHPSIDALLAALRRDPRAAWRRAGLVGLALVSLTALVAAGALGTLAWKARRRAAAATRIAQQFGQSIEKTTAIARESALLPLHDTRRERDEIRRRMAALEESMKSLGEVAAGPGHYALGRGWLALDRYDEAVRELEAAHASGYRSPELAWALGAVHGQLYQRALATLSKTNDPALDAARRAEIARAHREPALRYLKELSGDPGGVDVPEYVEALLALFERRFDDALALARKAAETNPRLFEAHTLEGDIHLVAGKERQLQGDDAGALAELSRAGVAYAEATTIARSSAAAYLGQCRRLVVESEIETDRDQPPDATVKQVLVACGAASTARPDDPAPWVAQANAWVNQAQYQRNRGADPTAAVDEANRLGERALALAPDEVTAHSTIARAFVQLAYYFADKSGDPRPAAARATAEAQRALALDPRSGAHELVGSAASLRGEWEGLHGQDPRPSYRAASEHSKKSIELFPDGFRAWNTLGNTDESTGQWEMVHGLDPSASFARALEAYRKVEKLVPTLDYGYTNECELELYWGQFQRLRAIDPSEHLRRAIDACNRGLAVDDRWAGVRGNLAWAYDELAAWQLERGIDPTPSLEHARAALKGALSPESVFTDPLDALCQSQLLEARWAAARGGDPRAAFAAAEATGRRALAVSDGESVDTLRLLAQLHRHRAEWWATRKASVAADVRAGLALAARALEKNPQLALAIATEGALHLLAARAAGDPRERSASAARARDALRSALDIDGNLDHEYRPLLGEATRLASVVY